MPERCKTCGKFKTAGRDHTCAAWGPRPTGNAKWRTDSPEAKAYRAEYAKAWRTEHPAYGKRYYDSAKSERDRARIAALFAYGGDPPRCACCQESTLEFLVLDHTNGGGNVERRAQGHKGGTATYVRLRRANWPAGYRVMCWNCNAAYGLYGACPHRAEGAISTL